MGVDSTGYDTQFFQNQVTGSPRVSGVVRFLCSLLTPKSVVDVGCGVGAWLSAFRDCQIEDVLGLDGDYVDRSLLLIPPDRFQVADLTNNIRLGRRFDLVVSLEVAEHLPAGRAAQFVSDLVALGDVILFSAAIPGQGGTNHLNEQWPEYWQRLFEDRGYKLVDCLRARFWHDPAVPGCYKQNMVLYVAADRLYTSPALQAECNRETPFPLSAVHPDVFHGIAQPPSLRPLLQAIPRAAIQAGRNFLVRLHKRFP